MSARLARQVAAAAGAMVLWAGPASAQLDPLLYLKSNQPNVIIAIDTANRMQRDAPIDATNPYGTSNYYDPSEYTKTGAAWENALNLAGVPNNTKYRRVYTGLTPASVGTDKFTASKICTMTTWSPYYAYFESGPQELTPCVDGNGLPLRWMPTRLSVARAALAQAIAENQSVARFGLVRMRQANNASPGAGGPVWVSNPGQQNPTDVVLVNNGRWNINVGTVTQSNGSQNSAYNGNVAADANANATILTTVKTAGSILAAGIDNATTEDAPVNYMLTDARDAATKLIKNDAACRNTVVVLIVGGGEGKNNTSGSINATLGTTASTFLSVYNNHRVPIYVIAIAPNNDNGDVAALQSIATNSGGQYFEISRDMIKTATASSMQLSYSQTLKMGNPLQTVVPAGTIVVPEVVNAINTAIQHAFAQQADFDVAPTVALPYGQPSEFPTTSPIIGTVNLAGAVDINGAALSPDPNTVLDRAGNVIPQRSNLMVTSGFSLPGFDGKLRGFRVYKPIVDLTQPSGWKFTSDGTRLWVASAPAAASRNLYTSLPDGTMIAFTEANAATLAPHMGLTNTTDATYVINAVRALPLGAVIDSTPAIMNPPSLDPPPDETYPAFAVANKDRRSMIFVGTNRGIIEGIDARLGQEVWGFIPFNLLPKLRTLADGQPVGNFDYFADGSPKISDVKLADGSWHTYLFIGEGPGGMFYQTFDVTLAGIATTLPPTDNSVADALSYFSSTTVMPLKWAFPTYADFDPALTVVTAYSNGTVVQPFGDLKASASAVEKSVGQTWSDPAIGQVVSASSPYVMIAGSGFMPSSVQQQANRGGLVAGQAFYIIDVNNGNVLSSSDVGNDGKAETTDICSISAEGCNQVKNALQSDAVATGPADSRFITKAFIGDLDGRIWRFDISLSGTTPTLSSHTKVFEQGDGQSIFNSLATVNVGGTQQYIFFGTGSDLMPLKNTGAFHIYGVLDNAGGAGVIQFDQKLAQSGSTTEVVTAFPAVAGDIVFFTTTTYNPTAACTAPSAQLYALTFIGGPAYDTNNDGKFDKKDSTLVKTVAGTRASAPFIVDQHLVFSAGKNVNVFGDPQDYNNGVGQAGVRILSWREAR